MISSELIGMECVGAFPLDPITGAIVGLFTKKKKPSPVPSAAAVAQTQADALQQQHVQAQIDADAKAASFKRMLIIGGIAMAGLAVTVVLLKRKKK